MTEAAMGVPGPAAAPVEATKLSLWRRVRSTPTGLLGVVLLAVVLLLALVGPLLAPHTMSEIVGPPFKRPGGGAVLGTDFLGRDVLSRIMISGRLLPLVALSAVIIAYVIGGVIGLLLGMRRDAVDTMGIAVIDVLLSIPPLIAALLLLAAVGTGTLVTGFALAAVLLPPIIRVVRVATLEVAEMEYVEAAVARGEGMLRLVVFEVLPNIRGTVVADFGIRVAYATLLYASLSFLGLGPQPPATDWGLMVGENRVGLVANPFAVVVPALLIAAFTVGVTFIADALVRSTGRTEMYR